MNPHPHKPNSPWGSVYSSKPEHHNSHLLHCLSEQHTLTHKTHILKGVASHITYHTRTLVACRYLLPFPSVKRQKDGPKCGLENWEKGRYNRCLHAHTNTHTRRENIVSASHRTAVAHTHVYMCIYIYTYIKTHTHSLIPEVSPLGDHLDSVVLSVRYSALL